MWHFTGEGQVYHRDETSGTPVTINWSSLSHGGNVCDTRENKVKTDVGQNRHTVQLTNVTFCRITTTS